MGDFKTLYKSGPLVSIEASRMMSPQFAIGVDGNYIKNGASDDYQTFLDTSVGPGTDGNAKLMHYGAHAKYMMSTKTGNRMTPYLVGGGGLYHIKEEISNSGVTVSASDNKFGLRGGVGLNWMLGPKMGLGFQADYNDIFTSGGSEAVETALKLARQYQVEIGQTKRHRILSRHQSYHGATLGAMAVSGNLLRREIYLPMLRDSAKINSPYPYRCPYHCTDQCDKCGHKLAQELDEALNSCHGEAAAFIFEPVSGATLGAVAPPNGYLRDLAGIAKRHGILLISDEVMTGFGRTGRNFCYEHWGKGDWAPDIICAAKGIASGYAPLGAVIANACKQGGVVSAISGVRADPFDKVELTFHLFEWHLAACRDIELTTLTRSVTNISLRC